MMLNRRWMIAAVAAAGLALVAINGTRPNWFGATGEAAAGVCEANPKPANLNFTLKDVSGKAVNLASFKGKVILLDFWATWCPPCKVEIPGFVDLYAKYKDRGFVVVGLSVDDTIDLLKPFVAQYRMNYPVLLGLGNDAIQDAYGPIWGLPTTFVIGRDGKICKKHMGLTSKEQFEKEILGLL
jgi:peroxiredoxin